MTRLYNKITDEIQEVTLDQLQDLIINLYSRMNRNEIYKELNNLGYRFPLTTARSFIDNLGITRKPGMLCRERFRRHCKLCLIDYAPHTVRQSFCEICVPKGDRTANFCAKRYNISRSELNTMLAAQNNACAICKLTFLEHKNQHIDHCHKSGMMRGFLCLTCNTGIGMLKDSPQNLRRAAEYIERASEKTK